jgi:hypothetical protein
MGSEAVELWRKQIWRLEQIEQRARIHEIAERVASIEPIAYAPSCWDAIQYRNQSKHAHLTLRFPDGHYVSLHKASWARFLDYLIWDPISPYNRQAVA